MTQEDKNMLLKDLCARLPYGVKFTFTGDDIRTAKGIDLRVTDDGEWEYFAVSKGALAVEITDIKPYLRPMSSMTEEEKEMMKGSVICFNELEGNSTLFDEIGLDWLISHHFDYRGLIPMGLALEAKEGMYKNE